MKVWVHCIAGNPPQEATYHVSLSSCQHHLHICFSLDWEHMVMLVIIEAPAMYDGPVEASATPP